MKEILAMDIECYRNYFLVMFRNLKTGNTRAFEMFEDQKLDVETIQKIINSYTIITFNGKNYDLPMLAYALKGPNCDQLRTASDAIIVGGVKFWEFERQFSCTIPQVDHIDIFEVAPGRVSLKIYGGRLHSKKMQDLPIDPGAMITEAQRPLMRLYCGNDLETTSELFNYLRPQIDLRVKMSKEYKIDLRSKSDAQIAEAVIALQVAKLLGRDVYRPPIFPGTGFKYRAPDYIKFTSTDMKRTLEMVENTTFVISKHGNVEMPDSLGDYKIKIGDGVYRMGIGGLHSSEVSICHEADENEILFDHDVASYYPAIISNSNLYPKHIGPEFLIVYKGFIEKRLLAKRGGDKTTSDVLKIFLNGSFGKFGSKWSKIYSPDLLIQTTMTGQLALLMLIEELEHNNIKVVSANTDGIVTKCPPSMQNIMGDIINGWELRTKFEIESSSYKAIYFANVNNYLALKADGKTKTKGVFAEPGLSKNPVNEICIEAAVKFIKDKIPLKKTILECKDIRKFVTIRAVAGGGVKDGVFLGKAVRWYYGKNSPGVIRYKTNNNTVARSEGAKPLIEISDIFPVDVNYDRYITDTKFRLVVVVFYSRLIK